MAKEDTLTTLQQSTSNSNDESITVEMKETMKEINTTTTIEVEGEVAQATVSSTTTAATTSVQVETSASNTKPAGKHTATRKLTSSNDDSTMGNSKNLKEDTAKVKDNVAGDKNATESDRAFLIEYADEKVLREMLLEAYERVANDKMRYQGKLQVHDLFR